MPKVSVIMGVYNCAGTLGEALDSLYCQTFQDFEIILCDDGSDDGTYEVAQAAQRTHSNVILCRHPRNMGLAYALNTCLEYASGEYIARMDGDDVSLPERLEVLNDFLDTHPEYAVVSSPMFHFDGDGVFRIGRGKGVIQKKDFLSGTPICHAPCMMRVKALSAVGGYSTDFLNGRIEDYYLWFKIYSAGFKMYELDTPYYKMRDLHRTESGKASNGLSYRLLEARLKLRGFGMIHAPWYSFFYVVRSLVLGLLPYPLYRWLHKVKRG